jgi:nicotinamidase-related amidase
MDFEGESLAPNKHSRRELGASQVDSRLGRRPDERVVVKQYSSAFKGTNLQEMLTWLAVDTLIVTGCSTSHCIYATCRDAASSFRVVVPREAVGDRSELFHEVNLLDIDLAIGDTMPVSEVLDRIRETVAYL